MRETGAVIGFKAHTGWAAFVAVGGTAAKLEVFARGKMPLLPDDSISRFVYHEASEMSDARAEEFVARAEVAARSCAAIAVGSLLEDLDARNIVPTACVVVRGSSEMKAGMPLKAILQAHPSIHAAEGKLYRDVISTACRDRGLEVVEVLERDIWKVAARASRCNEATLRDRIAALRAVLGAPWGADEKLLVAAALAVKSGARVVA